MYIRDVSAPAGSHSQRGISISRERARESAGLVSRAICSFELFRASGDRSDRPF